MLEFLDYCILYDASKMDKREYFSMYLSFMLLCEQVLLNASLTDSVKIYLVLEK